MIWRAFVLLLQRSKCEVVARGSKASATYARMMHRAKTLGDEQRYVNIAGGAKKSAEVAAAMVWLESMGLSRWARIVPGPLIRATSGYGFTHMPLATDSTYTHLVAAIEKAYEVSSAMEEPDAEFVLQGLDEPKFGNHSLRRHGDKLARMEMERSGADKQMID